MRIGLIYNTLLYYWYMAWLFFVLFYLQRIQLHFSRFELDYYNDECVRDIVYIHDGRDALAQLTHKICLRTFSVDDIISSGNTIFVHFVSDGSRRGPGFEIQYSSFEGKTGCCSNVIKIRLLFVSMDYGCICNTPISVNFLSNIDYEV